MSLTNQVLKDLAQRQSREEEGSLALETSGQGVGPKKSSFRWMILLVLLLGLGAALFLGVKLPIPAQLLGLVGKPPPEAGPAPQVPAPMPRVAPAPVPQAAPPPVKLPNLLSGFRHDESRPWNRLVFDLTEAPRFRFSMEEVKGRMEIILQGTKSAISLERVDLEQTLLKDLKMEEQGEDLYLGVWLKEPVFVKYSTLAPEGGFSYRLIVDIHPKGDRDQPPPQTAAAPIRPPAPIRQEAALAPPVVSEMPVPMAPAPRGEAVKRPAKREPEHPREAYEMGVSHLERGQRAEGERLLQRALSLDPGHLLARESLAKAWIAGNRISEADALLAEGVAIHPTSDALAWLYGRILAARGDVAGAVRVLDRALPQVKDNPDYYAFLAGLYLKGERPDRAAVLYGDALGVRPHAGVWWMGLGLALEKNREPEKALSAFRHALVGGALSPAVKRFVLERIERLEKGAGAGKEKAS